MRLWSIHPKYLDTVGLVALWRETLLAKKVLEGNTQGYINHPQLERFKQKEKPLDALNHYLYHVYTESLERGFTFNKNKFIHNSFSEKISISKKQKEYEFNHLQKKLDKRNKIKYIENLEVKEIKLNPIFKETSGPIAVWEKV